MPSGALPVYTMRGGVVEESSVSPGSDGLDQWATHCAGCPARTYDQPFGCYGFIGYPIRAATEQWLIERAKQMGVTCAVAIDVLAQIEITGAHAADLRARGRTFFESPAPAGVIWQLDGGGEVVLTSDLIVELAVFRLPGNLRLFPLAAIVLGLVPPSTTVEAIAGWMKFPKTIMPALVMPADDPAHQDVVDYLRQLIVAARGGFDVVVDG
jgi:hypothetical protein